MVEQAPLDRRVQELKEEMFVDFAHALTKAEVVEVVDRCHQKLAAKATVTDFIGVLLKRSSRTELSCLARSKDVDLSEESRSSGRSPAQDGRIAEPSTT